MDEHGAEPRGVTVSIRSVRWEQKSGEIVTAKGSRKTEKETRMAILSDKTALVTGGARGVEAHAGRRSHHHDRLVRGRAHDDARLGALRGHEGSRQDVYAGVVPRGGEPRHHGQ